MAIERGKIVIIGAGHVGSAILNSLLGMNLAKVIVLINLDREQALGEVLDAGHTLAFAYTAGCTIRVGDPHQRDQSLRCADLLLHEKIRLSAGEMLLHRHAAGYSTLLHDASRQALHRSQICDRLCAGRAGRHSVHPLEHGQHRRHSL
ncbi:MAG: hypothetical protein IKU38_08580 [Clostridia bacterium]|nr:hypothetical protein [Clostridia bacterium]